MFFTFDSSKIIKETQEMVNIFLKNKLDNMKKRTLELSLETAKEWFNGNDNSLKKLALEVYTKEELTKERWESIKTFDDVLSVLGMPPSTFAITFNRLRIDSPASAAAFKVNLIKKALNKNYNFSLTKNEVWFPFTPFITENSTWYKDDLELGNKYIVGKIKYNNTIYKVLNGDAYCGGNAGLGDFYSADGVGNAYASVGCLGCASPEIAEHFGKYFWKEIYQMMYADMIPDIEYIDLVVRN